MILRNVIEIKAKTKFGNMEVLCTNLKKAYDDYYLGYCKDAEERPLAYSTVAADLKAKGFFYHGDVKVYITKRNVF
ncbi:MAG: hypothetical protein ACXVAY_01490 [Mucilaginibacter sp.]